MPGYGGQLVALNSNTPSESELAAAQADEAQSRAQVLRATAPAQIDLMRQQAVGAGLANQTNALTYQQAAQQWALRQSMAKAMASATQPPSQLATAPGGQSSQPSALAAQAPQQPALFDQRVQAVMQGINPDDPDAPAKWDQQMGALAKDGVPQAQQFVGHYSRPNVTGWRSQIGTHVAQNAAPLPSVDRSTPFAQAFSPLGAPDAAGSSPPPATPLATSAAPPSATPPASQLATPTAPAGAPSPASPLAPQAIVNPLTGKADPELTQMAILFPKEYGEQMKTFGMMRYLQTGNMQDLRRYAPDEFLKLTEADKNMTMAQKEALATQSSTVGSKANAVLALAHQAAQKGLDPQNVPEVRAAYNSGIIFAANQKWMTPQEAQIRLQSPIDFGWLTQKAVEAQTVAEHMKSSGQEAGNEAAARFPFDRQYQQGGTNPETGTAVTFNARTGQYSDTGVKVGARPSAAMGVFQSKHDMWLTANPGDEKGALEFANGKRDMSPTQIAVAATNAALKEQANAAYTQPGQKFDYDAAYQRQLATMQQAATTPAAPTTPAAAAQGSPTAVNAKGYTQAQANAAAHYTQTGVLPGYGHVGFDPKAPKGSIKNPVAPRTPQEYAALPVGAIYIGQDGIPRQKKK